MCMGVLELENNQNGYLRVRVCAYMYVLCVYGRENSRYVMYGIAMGVGGGKNDQGCVNMGADGYRSVSKHAGTTICHTELDIVPKTHIQPRAKAQSKYKKTTFDSITLLKTN